MSKRFFLHRARFFLALELQFSQLRGAFDGSVDHVQRHLCVGLVELERLLRSDRFPHLGQVLEAHWPGHGELSCTRRLGSGFWSGPGRACARRFLGFGFG